MAAALGDDASFATTVTNSIATKLPLAGGTISGNLNVNGLIGFAGDTRYGVAKIYNSSIGDIFGLEQVSAGQAGGAGAATRVFVAGNGPSNFISLGWYTNATNFVNGLTIVVGSGATTIHGSLTVTGTITESSSLKLKENIETSEGNLEKVVNLRPVTYNKIGSQTTELGLIAEEVAEVYPEFVQYDENGEPVGVNYSRLTAALIGAVKELTNQVQELNKKING